MMLALRKRGEILLGDIQVSRCYILKRARNIETERSTGHYHCEWMCQVLIIAQNGSSVFPFLGL
jgi:hypothetical protein